MNERGILACLLGGAVGDALGAPVEFMSWPEIRERFGPRGVTECVPAYGRTGAVTDDTQMMLFTLEGFMRAGMRLSDRGVCHYASVVLHAYQRWLLTQGEEPLELDPSIRSGWLWQQEFLHHRRAPGNTCLSSLRQSVFLAPEYGAEPMNDSKGCGGLMRMAPAGFLKGNVFLAGAEMAALTHGHPSGYLSAGVLARVVAYLLDGIPLRTAVMRARTELTGYGRHEECATAIDRALEWAGNREPTPETIEALGGGWVAEEALAIALFCALSAENFQVGVLRAVNHGGDSDSTGLLAGTLLGLVYGLDAIPVEWLEELEGRDIITELAADAAVILDGERLGSLKWRKNPREYLRLMERYPPN